MKARFSRYCCQYPSDVERWSTAGAQSRRRWLRARCRGWVFDWRQAYISRIGLAYRRRWNEIEERARQVDKESVKGSETQTDTQVGPAVAQEKNRKKCNSRCFYVLFFKENVLWLETRCRYLCRLIWINMLPQYFIKAVLEQLLDCIVSCSLVILRLSWEKVPILSPRNFLGSAPASENQRDR